MILPYTFLTLVFYVLRDPKWRDAFYFWYKNYLEKRNVVKIYIFHNVDKLIHDFPDKVELRDGNIIFKNVTIFNEGFIRLNSKAFFIKDNFCYYSFLKNLRHFKKSKTRDHLDQGYSMTGMYSTSFNLFHLITDTLVPNASEGKIKGTVILPKIFNEFQQKLIDVLSINDYIQVKDSINVKELSVRMRKSKWEITPYDHFRKLLGVANERTSDANKVVFITRKNTRRSFKNEDELVDSFKQYNIETVDFGKITLEERTLLLSKTKILIGQYGAGLTNMIFMPKNSYVIDLQNGNWVKNDYCLLANSCRLNYMNVAFPIKAFSKKDPYKLTTDDIYQVKVVMDLILTIND